MESDSSVREEDDNHECDDEEVTDRLQHPFVGKEVEIVMGPCQGTTARILEIKSRGWWRLDNPSLPNPNIHSRRCRLLEDIDESELREYYERQGLKYRGLPPSLMQRRTLSISHSVVRQGNNMLRGLYEDSVVARTLEALGSAGDSIRNRYGLSFQPRGKQGQNRKGNSPSPAAHSESENEKSAEHSLQQPQTLAELIDLQGPSVPYADNGSIQLDPKSIPNKHYSTYASKVLPPVVLENDGTVDHLKYGVSVDCSVKIIDRKSGLVLDGEVPFAKLGELLERHAEYEPIFPHPSTGGPVRWRQGRTCGVRIRGSVHRQRQESLATGTGVQFIAGKYKGRKGSIASRLPGGGWYTVIVGGMQEVFATRSDLSERKHHRQESTSGRRSNGRKKLKQLDPEQLFRGGLQMESERRVEEAKRLCEQFEQLTEALEQATSPQRKEQVKKQMQEISKRLQVIQAEMPEEHLLFNDAPEPVNVDIDVASK